MNQYYNQPNHYRQGVNQFQGQGFFPGQNQGFPAQQQGFNGFPPAGTPAPAPAPAPQTQGMLPIEQSYIENILRLNKGKLVTVYATFEGSTQWNSKAFKGIIEAAGRDHIILSDPQTGQRTLITMVSFDYATFDEEIEYEYPYGAPAPSLGTYPPR